MAKNYIQDGQTMDYHNGGSVAVLSGSPVAVGALVGIALDTIPAGGDGTLLMSGVWSLPKATATAVGKGEKVYLKDGLITTTATDATLAGYAWLAAPNGSSAVQVKLIG